MMQQTDFPVELVIGEDLSGDGTREICEELQRKHPGRIRLLPSDRNYGQNANLQRILSACDGRYIAFCEVDDYWTDPLKLQKQVDFLEAHPGCVLCFHRIRAVDENGRLVSCDKPSDQILFYRKEDIVHVFVPTLAMVFRNCLAGLPPEFFRVRSTDAFLVAMLTRYGDAADLGFIGGSYRRHPGGLYNRLNMLDRYKQAIHTRKLMLTCGCFEPWQHRAIRKELHRRLRMYVKGFLKTMQLKNAVRIIQFYFQ